MGGLSAVRRIRQVLSNGDVREYFISVPDRCTPLGISRQGNQQEAARQDIFNHIDQPTLPGFCRMNSSQLPGLFRLPPAPPFLLISAGIFSATWFWKW